MVHAAVRIRPTALGHRRRNPVVLVTARWRGRRLVRSTNPPHILESSTSPGPRRKADKDSANEFGPTVTPRSQAGGVRARRYNAV